MSTERHSESSESPTHSSLLKRVSPDLTTAGIVVSSETPVGALPDAIASNRDCQTIAVVDATGKLVGIIPVDTVIHYLLLHVLPGEFFAEVQELERAAELIKEQHAHTAGDLMHPPVSVPASATVREAFHLIHRAGLNGLPVVDEHEQVSGYIDLFRLLLARLEKEPPPQASR